MEIIQRQRVVPSMLITINPSVQTDLRSTYRTCMHAFTECSIGDTLISIRSMVAYHSSTVLRIFLTPSS